MNGNKMISLLILSTLVSFASTKEPLLRIRAVAIKNNGTEVDLRCTSNDPEAAVVWNDIDNIDIPNEYVNFDSRPCGIPVGLCPGQHEYNCNHGVIHNVRYASRRIYNYKWEAYPEMKLDSERKLCIEYTTEDGVVFVSARGPCNSSVHFESCAGNGTIPMENASNNGTTVSNESSQNSVWCQRVSSPELSVNMDKWRTYSIRWRGRDTWFGDDDSRTLLRKWTIDESYSRSVCMTSTNPMRIRLHCDWDEKLGTTSRRADEHRGATITISKKNHHNSLSAWPHVICEKLAHDGHSVFSDAWSVLRMPTKLKAKDLGHGIVTLNVKTVVKEAEIEASMYKIHVAIEEQFLQDEVVLNKTEYPIDNKTIILHLWPSTKYRFTLKKFSQNSYPVSTRINRTILLSSSVGLPATETIRKNVQSSSVELIIPRLINTTKLHSVEFVVEVRGNFTCQDSLKTMKYRDEWKFFRPQNTSNITLPFTVSDDRIEHFLCHDQNYTFIVHAVINGSTAYVGRQYIKTDPRPPVPISAPGTTAMSSRVNKGTAKTDSRPAVQTSAPGTTAMSSRVNKGIALTADNYQSSSNLGWLTMLLIPGFAIVGYVVYKKRERLWATRIFSRNESNALTEHPKHSSYTSDSIENLVSDEPIYDTPDTDDHGYSYSVDILKFEDYVKRSVESDRLSSQFATLPMELTGSCEYGKLLKNMKKNKSQNQLPFDETRVILRKIPGISNSDYINANYIRGVRGEKNYIATQDPLPDTVVDFWRMIWDLEVTVICMLSDANERDEEQCMGYWPQAGTEEVYGKIKVSNGCHQIFPDYIISTLALAFEDEIHRVEHMNYIRWPKRSVPAQFNTFIEFLQNLSASRTAGSPIVVHSSVGAGRAGTLILSDICIRRCSLDRVVDVVTELVKIRHDRPNMVECQEQYILVHLAIIMSELAGSVKINCAGTLPAKVERIKPQLVEQFRRLKELAWVDATLDSLMNPLIGSSNFSMHKDGAKSVLCSEYTDITAVIGVIPHQQYFSSSLPSQAKLKDFWSFVANKKASMIIVLQPPHPDDPNYCDIIPKKQKPIHVTSFLKVEKTSSPGVDQYFTTTNLRITDISKQPTGVLSVVVLTLKHWGSRVNHKSYNPKAMVRLWQATQIVSWQKGPTIVLCRNGVTQCGLYLALNLLLERMCVEQLCDVCSAVRSIRRCNSKFIQTQEEFNYLYESAVNYIEHFGPYSNFCRLTNNRGG